MNNIHLIPNQNHLDIVKVIKFPRKRNLLIGKAFNVGPYIVLQNDQNIPVDVFPNIQQLKIYLLGTTTLPS